MLRNVVIVFIIILISANGVVYLYNKTTPACGYYEKAMKTKKDRIKMLGSIPSKFDRPKAPVVDQEIIFYPNGNVDLTVKKENAELVNAIDEMFTVRKTEKSNAVDVINTYGGEQRVRFNSAMEGIGAGNITATLNVRDNSLAYESTKDGYQDRDPHAY